MEPHEIQPLKTRVAKAPALMIDSFTAIRQGCWDELRAIDEDLKFAKLEIREKNKKRKKLLATLRKMHFIQVAAEKLI